MTMETFETVRTILAVRSYQDHPVPEAVLREVVDAGRLTASARNRQPWHFIVVQDRDTLKRLGEMATTGAYISEAAAAIVVAIAETRNSVSDASRAIQSMLLTAWSHGVGGNWVGTGPNGIDGLNDYLNIPAELRVLAILPLGYPDHDIGHGKKDRKPLSEIASLNRFEQAFE
jgi:nitroreductase